MKCPSRSAFQRLQTIAGTALCASAAFAYGSAEPQLGPLCGNGQLDLGEQCDDGNTADRDGCQANCLLPLGDPGDFASDDFGGCALDSRWEVVNPQGHGIVTLTTASASEAALSLWLPGGALHDAWSTTGNAALRVMQRLSSPPGDLELEVKFDSEPTGGYSDQGILIEQDAATYLRFDVYHGGGRLTAFAGKTIGGTNIVAFSATIASGAARHMRVTRSADQWTLWISADGASWSRVGTTTQILTVGAVGVYAANPVSGSEFNAHVDYFFNVAAPMLPEDGAADGCDCVDDDGDGFGVGSGCEAQDCDDTDAGVYPDAPETCDGRDEDCDGQVDDGFDVDGDGSSACAGDCDDDDPGAFPAATEVCDGLDNDCDGGVDDGLSSLTVLVEQHRIGPELQVRLPLEGMFVQVFDRTPRSCAKRNCGASALSYECIVNTCGALASGFTDGAGAVRFELPAGYYLAIAGDGSDVHLGTTVGELECGDHPVRRLRQFVRSRPAGVITGITPSPGP